MKTPRPIESGILFKFIETIVDGAFENATSSGIIIKSRSSDPKYPRWGVALSVGPKVSHVTPGQYILIENLQWTNALTYAGDKFWKTNENNVLLISDNYPT